MILSMAKIKQLNSEKQKHEEINVEKIKEKKLKKPHEQKKPAICGQPQACNRFDNPEAAREYFNQGFIYLQSASGTTLEFGQVHN